MYIGYIYSKFILKIRGKTVFQSSTHVKSKIGSGSWFYRSKIGKYSYTGYDCKIFDTEISSYCSIGNNVSIGIGNHPMHYLSTSPVFYSKKNAFKFAFNTIVQEPEIKTIIEADVWIGAGVYIKAGVNISKGAIIGMGSVLTKDVGPYEVWAGNPAKLIKKRFSDEKISELMKTNWEELTEDQIRDKTSIFHGIVMRQNI